MILSQKSQTVKVQESPIDQSERNLDLGCAGGYLPDMGEQNENFLQRTSQRNQTNMYESSPQTAEWGRFSPSEHSSRNRIDRKLESLRQQRSNLLSLITEYLDLLKNTNRDYCKILANPNSTQRAISQSSLRYEDILSQYQNVVNKYEPVIISLDSRIATLESSQPENSSPPLLSMNDPERFEYAPRLNHQRLQHIQMDHYDEFEPAEFGDSELNTSQSIFTIKSTAHSDQESQ